MTSISRQAIFVALSTFLFQDQTQQSPIVCPKIGCEEPYTNHQYCMIQTVDSPDLQEITTWNCEAYSKLTQRSAVCSWGHNNEDYLWPYRNEWFNQGSINFLDSGAKNFYGYCIDPDVLKGSGTLLPGQHCNEDGQCLNRQCNGGTCQGQLVGEDCSKSTDCAQGHYCDTTGEDGPVCVVAKEVNEECTQSLECKFQFDCLGGICRKYHTVDDEKSADSGVFCTSGMVRTVDYFDFSISGCTTANQMYHMSQSNPDFSPTDTLDQFNSCQPDSDPDMKCLPYYSYKNETYYQLSFDHGLFRHLDSKGLMMTGSNPVDSCICAQEQEGYCLPQGDESWFNLTSTWLNSVVPAIQDNCHQDLRYKPLLWNTCNNTSPEGIANITTFYDQYNEIIMSPYRNLKLQECIENIMPFSTFQQNVLQNALLNSVNLYIIATIGLFTTL